MLPLLVLIFICYWDLATHKITNRSLIALSVSFYFSCGGEVRLLSGLLIFLALLIAGLKLSLGGGDIKLITVLVLFADTNFALIDYLEISMVVGGLHLVFDFAKKGSFAGNLALAPTICAPMICSLALS